jgi:hypothetical protein
MAWTTSESAVRVVDAAATPPARDTLTLGSAGGGGESSLLSLSSSLL